MLWSSYCGSILDLGYNHDSRGVYGDDVGGWSRPLEQKILFGAPYLRGLSGGDRMLIVCCVVP